MALPIISNPDNIETIQDISQSKSAAMEDFQITFNDLFKNMGRAFETIIDKIDTLIVGQEKLISFRAAELDLQKDREANALENRIEDERSKQLRGGVDDGDGVDKKGQFASALEAIKDSGFLSNVLGLLVTGGILNKFLDRYFKKKFGEDTIDIPQEGEEGFKKDRNFFDTLKSGLIASSTAALAAPKIISGATTAVSTAAKGVINKVTGKDLKDTITERGDGKSKIVGKDKTLTKQDLDDFDKKLDKKLKKQGFKTALKGIPIIGQIIGGGIAVAEGATAAFTDTVDFKGKSDAQDKFLTGVRETFNSFASDSLDFVKDIAVVKGAEKLGLEGIAESVKGFSFRNEFTQLFNKLAGGDANLEARSELREQLKEEGLEKPESVDQLNKRVDFLSKQIIDEQAKVGPKGELTEESSKRLELLQRQKEIDEKTLQKLRNEAGRKPSGEEISLKDTLVNDAEITAQNVMLKMTPRQGDMLTAMGSSQKSPTIIMSNDNSSKTFNQTNSRVAASTNRISGGTISATDSSRTRRPIYG
jgi:hypothetical protein